MDKAVCLSNCFISTVLHKLHHHYQSPLPPNNTADKPQFDSSLCYCLMFNFVYLL